MKHALRVVKLGGSLYRRPDLSAILDKALSTDAQTPVLVVPGGGVFADRIRARQALSGWSEQVAHEKALDAMSQASEWLLRLPGPLSHAERLHARLLTAAACDSAPDSVSDFARDSARDLPLPSAGMLVAARLPRLSVLHGCAHLSSVRELPVGWQTTSDSVALWCARVLGAAHLTLIKSVPPDSTDPVRLAAEGYLDGTFPALFRGFPGQSDVCWPGAENPVQLRDLR